MKLGDLATQLECKMEGAADLEITGVAGMDEANANEITFLSNPKYLAKLHTTQAGAIIAGADVDTLGKPVLRSADPYMSFAQALEVFYPPRRPPAGIHPTAVIAPDVKLGNNPSIGPYVVIEDGAEIGDDCILKGFVMIYPGVKIGDRFTAHSHAVVRENVRIGNDVILQNGVVIGGDGFGFAPRPDGTFYKIVQAGIVIIEDRVEVQSNSCIDRAAVGETRLRRGVKVDNLVQVAHGCDIGDNSLLCSQVGIAGSTKLGRNVILTGQVGVAGHLTIGDRVIATPQTGVPNDVRPNTTISGSPAVDHEVWLKASAIYRRLPEMYAAYRKMKSFIEKDKS
ncbi:MAG: UDP-3-O-(3-hydroxymyristoyl)glucosamine N-acyltransferase [Acidobacteriota bacterium]|nr:UDP-3-O-(3-hydroxymyristoyl)glucosamine N-acyltransferase [Acidobacteriota bacterium]